MLDQKDEIQVQLALIDDILSRAMADEQYYEALIRRPMAVLTSEGVDLLVLLRALSGLGYASDRELLETMHALVQGVRERNGCGHCGSPKGCTEGVVSPAQKFPVATA